jgi:hypothetical protein
MNNNKVHEDINKINTNSTLDKVVKILNISTQYQSAFIEKYYDIDNSELIAKILKEDKKYRANKNLAKYAIRFI